MLALYYVMFNWVSVSVDVVIDKDVLFEVSDNMLINSHQLGPLSITMYRSTGADNNNYCTKEMQDICIERY